MSKNLIVDISHHQPSNKFDWTKAAKEVALMIIRVQYGSTTIDREYKKHVANCKKHGIPFGHYAYARFTSISDAIVEAKDFLKRADKDAKFLVVDVEEQTIRNVADMSPATQMFVDTLKNAGWKVGLYTGHHTYKPLRMDKVKADFLWIPRYGRNDGTPTTKPDYPCDLWQYTEKGRVSWYPSFLDLNKLNGSKPLEWFIGAEVNSKGADDVGLEDARLKAKPEADRIGVLKVLANTVLREEPDNKSKLIRHIEPGGEYKVSEYKNGWYRIGGWIHSEYVNFLPNENVKISL